MSYFQPAYDLRVKVLTERIAGIIQRFGLDNPRLDLVLQRPQIRTACDALGLTLDQLVTRAGRVTSPENLEIRARYAQQIEEKLFDEDQADPND